MKYILILKVVTSNSAMLYLELKSFPQKLLFEPSKSFRDAVLTRAFRRSFLITAKRDKRAKMYQKTYFPHTMAFPRLFLSHQVGFSTHSM